ncbi:MAG: TonB-dependent receptor [Alistipes sp.]|nr:TonB-dependent receptor [Alistipes sp.]
MAMSNPDLTWQTTKKLNIGLTSSFLDDRLNINFDYWVVWPSLRIL